MQNTKMYDTKNVLNQYKDGKNLNTRISIYQKYGTNDQKYSDWIHTNYGFFEGSKILEFGCGTGKDWKDNIDGIPNRAMIILSDFSSGLVDELQEQFGDRDNVDIMQLDIQNSNMQTSSMDFIIANSMLYHVPDIDKAISEVARILKDSGVFYASTFSDKSMIGYLNQHLKNVSSDISLPQDFSFTLQNGGAYLEKYFSNVKINRYNNGLKIKDTNDLVEYIYSMTSIVGIKDEHRADIYDYFESIKSNDGSIQIEIEYGVFVASNHSKDQ